MDPFSELTLYRRVAIQDVDTFKEDWKMLKREFSDQMNNSAVAPNEPKAGEPTPDKGCLKSGKRKAGTNPDSVKAAVKKTAKTEDPNGDGAENERKNALKQMIRNGTKLKEKALKTMTMADALVQKIPTSKAYAWANNAENLGNLEAKINEVKNSFSDWAHDWMVMDGAAIRKKYSTSHMETELLAFMQHDRPLEELANMTATITRRSNM